MLSSGFTGGKDQLQTLSENLRGDVLYNATLDAEAREIKEWPNGRKTFTVKGVSFTMVLVKGGTFTMGATSEQGSDANIDEKPTHQVTLSKFSIGQTEVTQELWEAVMGSNPSDRKGAKRPVEEVSWNNCQEFIRKLNALTGQNFRLPTEAEWEYAARGGNKSQGYKYSGSNNIDDVAWYWINSGDSRLSGNWYSEKIENNNCQTHDVGTKQPNELGLYDMSGNVYEWCQDWYGSYSSEAQVDPRGPSSGSSRVYRGGSWFVNAEDCRVTCRSGLFPDNRNNNLGFRLAL
ncbi:MAG: formylglycine-generating enzyme family protein [Muribaculaceae bacterium]|nr:formylglycine-generating enzyme family protein [Muribaculaceae bacterium]